MTNPVRRDLLTYRQSSSAIVLNHQRQILLIQKTIFCNNEWDIPGGGVENGETPEMAILRELEEELGCNKFRIVSKSRYIYQYDWPDEIIVKRLIDKGEAYRGQQRTQFVTKFLGRPDEITPNPSEIKTIKWVDLNDLARHLTFPGQLSGLKLILKEL